MSGNELQAQKSKLSMLQHRSYNINVSTPIPPSNAPNRQKPQKSLTAKNPKNPQKFPRHKNPKKPRQKFPTDKNSRQTKNPKQNGTLRKTLRLDQPELFCFTNQLP
jgi:hypothetical protein